MNFAEMVGDTHYPEKCPTCGIKDFCIITAITEAKNAGKITERDGLKLLMAGLETIQAGIAMLGGGEETAIMVTKFVFDLTKEDIEKRGEPVAENTLIIVDSEGYKGHAS